MVRDQGSGIRDQGSGISLIVRGPAALVKIGLWFVAGDFPNPTFAGSLIPDPRLPITIEAT